jgi:hypothetical protein
MLGARRPIALIPVMARHQCASEQATMKKRLNSVRGRGDDKNT